MNAALIHVYGPGLIGAVVIDLDEDRVIAESPSLRFMDHWTRNQVNSYAQNLSVRNELLSGSWEPPVLKPQAELKVHQPLQPGGCWAMMHIPARRSGRVPAYDTNCGQKARTKSFCCGWHVKHEEAAQALFDQLRREKGLPK